MTSQGSIIIKVSVVTCRRLFFINVDVAMLDHWLFNPTVQGLMARYTLYVSCNASVQLGQYVKTSVRVITSEEARREYLRVGPGEVPCCYSRTGCSRGSAYRSIPVALLSPMQPENKTQALIIKAVPPMKVSHPREKDVKVVLESDDVFGQVVYYVKKDKLDRNDRSPDAPLVACIKLLGELKGLPEGTNLRIPIDTICRIAFVKT